MSEVKLDKPFDGATPPPRPGGLHQRSASKRKEQKKISVHAIEMSFFGGSARLSS
jgi:hypothetical protein